MLICFSVTNPGCNIDVLCKAAWSRKRNHSFRLKQPNNETSWLFSHIHFFFFSNATRKKCWQRVRSMYVWPSILSVPFFPFLPRRPSIRCKNLFSRAINQTSRDKKKRKKERNGREWLRKETVCLSVGVSVFISPSSRLHDSLVDLRAMLPLISSQQQRQQLASLPPAFHVAFLKASQLLLLLLPLNLLITPRPSLLLRRSTIFRGKLIFWPENKSPDFSLQVFFFHFSPLQPFSLSLSPLFFYPANHAAASIRRQPTTTESTIRRPRSIVTCEFKDRSMVTTPLKSRRKAS